MQPIEKLTPREIQIVALICDGMSDKEIAAQLSLSTATDRTHRKSILKKLNIKKAVLLVRFVYENKIV